MAGLILMSHALTRAQQQGIFPGKDKLDSALIVPDSVTVPACAVTFTANFEPAILTARKLGLDATIDAAIPVSDYGRWQGLSLKQLAKEEGEYLQQWLSDPCSAPHGGTSFEELYEKTNKWLEAYLDLSRSTLVIAEAVFLRMVVLIVLKAPVSSLPNIDIEPLTMLKLNNRHKSWVLCFESQN